jgi:hypothetical protein
LQDIVDEAGALQEMAQILKSTKFSDKYSICTLALTFEKFFSFQAYNRLYKWLQEKFARVHSDATDIPPLMKSAVMALRTR